MTVQVAGLALRDGFLKKSKDSDDTVGDLSQNPCHIDVQKARQFVSLWENYTSAEMSAHPTSSSVGVGKLKSIVPSLKFLPV
jgi:hypothetical protein